MQTVYMHEDEEGTSGEANSMGVVICAGRVSRHLEEEHVGGPGGRTIRIQDSRRILDRYKRGVWKRR